MPAEGFQEYKFLGLPKSDAAVEVSRSVNKTTARKDGQGHSVRKDFN